jgi:hypothetical protein
MGPSADRAPGKAGNQGSTGTPGRIGRLDTSPSSALARLIKRFVARGFEDGEPETPETIGNVEVKRDEAGRLRPVKPRVTGSHRKRIDGVVALLMGLAVLTRPPALEPERQHQMIVLNAGARGDGWG